MSDTKRIVCTQQSDPKAPGHGHIIAVGVGNDPNQATAMESVDTVRYAILSGRTVHYTVSPSTGRRANVQTFDCWCGIKTIRSAPDAIWDNNLDSLRLCRI